jgi:hypothetical protein
MTYSTKYNLEFLNQAKAQISNVYIYYPTIVTSYPDPYSTTPVRQECLKLFKVAPSSSDSFTISRNETQWYGFSQNQVLINTCMKRSEFNGITWEGCYVDSVFSRIDTIILPDPVGLSQDKNPLIKSIPKFLQVIRNSKQVLFTTIFPNKVYSSQIRILSLDGKLIDILPIGPVTAGGTYSCEWNYYMSVKAGVYLCSLLINGEEVQSQKVQVW